MTAANMRLGAPPQVERITKSYKTTLKEIRLVQLSFKLNCTKRIWPHVKAAVTSQHSAAAMNFRFFENWPRITRGYILHKTVLKITTAVPSRNIWSHFQTYNDSVWTSRYTIFYRTKWGGNWLLPQVTIPLQQPLWEGCHNQSTEDSKRMRAKRVDSGEEVF